MRVSIVLALQRLAGRANEITQRGDVGAVGTYAPCVDGQAEALGEVEIYSSIVEFRQTEARCWLNAIHSGRIDRPRRTMAVPWTASQFVKLFPIAFVPSIHRAV